MRNNVPYDKNPWRSKDRKPRKGCRGKVVNSVVLFVALSYAVADRLLS